jgi:hypothetical protein
MQAIIVKRFIPGCMQGGFDEDTFPCYSNGSDSQYRTPFIIQASTGHIT